MLYRAISLAHTHDIGLVDLVLSYFFLGGGWWGACSWKITANESPHVIGTSFALSEAMDVCHKRLRCVDVCGFDVCVLNTKHMR